MTNLHLSPDVSLPKSAATETFGLLAGRGAGKTNTARVMAEEFWNAQIPFVAIDPVGSWWGLRSSRDGKSEGLPIPIFGGKHGDVPLERTGGALIADLIVSKRLSCVLDLTGFDSEAAKKQFLLDFARRLYLKNEEPLHLFLEEADDYIPQKPMRDEAHLLRAWENIVRRGRARGLGATFITQRSAVLNKNVLTQVGTLIAMRTTGPQDRKAIEMWLVSNAQATKEVMDSLPSLENGEGWVWSPHFIRKFIRTQFRLSNTFDSGATPTGTKRERKPATLADVDLEAVKVAMADTIERAESEDPRALQSKVRELQALLKKAHDAPAGAEPVRIRVVKMRLLNKRESKRLEVLKALLDESLSCTEQSKRELSDALELMKNLAEETRDLLTNIEKRSADQPITEAFLREPGKAPVRIDGILPQPMAMEPPPSRHARGELGNGELGKGERAVLTAIAQNGLRGATREEISVLTGYKRSTRDAYLNRLRTAEMTYDGSGGLVIATPLGTKALGSDFRPLPTGAALRTYWAERLPAGEKVLFTLIVSDYPNRVHRSDLDGLSGFKRSTRDAYLSRLATRKLISADSDGTVKASPNLFS